MSITVAAQLVPQSSLGATHEDVYGVGGYVALATGLTGSPTLLLIQQAINNQVVLARRKVGMLVFDATTSRYFRCTAPESGTWVESFANNGSIDLSGYVQRTELPTTGTPPVLDIASDTELAQFGLTALRVASDGTSNLTLGTTSNTATSDVWIRTAVPANVGTNTPAQLIFLLNTAAIGGTPGDPA